MGGTRIAGLIFLGSMVAVLADGPWWEGPLAAALMGIGITLYVED